MKVEDYKSRKEEMNEDDLGLQEDREGQEDKDPSQVDGEEKDLVGEIQAKYDDLQDKFLRLQADFTNFKRRSREEKNGYISLGLEKLAIDILPVLDNFDRALAMVEDRDSPFFEGMDLLAKQFIEILEKNDIREMKAKGQIFDPNLHHAVMVEQVEEIEPGKITEVLQKGYFHGEKVIRPAMVKVSE